MSISTLPTASEQARAAALAAESAAPLFPTETEIYLLPDGRVVIADLPAELAAALATLGSVEPCAVEPHAALPQS
jgi:hypothetical protein